ncbi:MAG TPA: hypothetical protein VMX55_08460 [candidate division Zixibacteria bacterium]|nr:hypothetical protein [candidate division Zixibacteria bacterium]
MDMIKKMMEEWKKELIDAGEIDPSEQLTQQELQMKYQEYQIKKMKSVMGGLGESLGIKMPEKEKPKKKKPTKPEPKESKKKKEIGGQERARFSQLLKEILDLQKSLDARFMHNLELFNALCSSSSPQLLEIINDQSKKDPEKKMKDVREIMKKLTSKTENGFPSPTGMEDELTDYLDQKDESNEELTSIYSQIKEKSELMVNSLSEMEEA